MASERNGLSNEELRCLMAASIVGGIAGPIRDAADLAMRGASLARAGLAVADEIIDQHQRDVSAIAKATGATHADP